MALSIMSSRNWKSHFQFQLLKNRSTQIMSGHGNTSFWLPRISSVLFDRGDLSYPAVNSLSWFPIVLQRSASRARGHLGGLAWPPYTGRFSRARPGPFNAKLRFAEKYLEKVHVLGKTDRLMIVLRRTRTFD